MGFKTSIIDGLAQALINPSNEEVKVFEGDIENLANFLEKKYVISHDCALDAAKQMIFRTDCC